MSQVLHLSGWHMINHFPILGFPFIKPWMVCACVRVCVCVCWVGDRREWSETKWELLVELRKALWLPATQFGWLGGLTRPFWVPPFTVLTTVSPRDRRSTRRSWDTFPSIMCVQQQEAWAGEEGSRKARLHLYFSPSLSVPNTQQKDLFIAVIFNHFHLMAHIN